MIRARNLSGRAVVDMDVAEKLGSVDKVILDPDVRRVAALVVTRRPNVLANEVRITVPASAVHAIGPDAITVHRSRAASAADIPIQALPSVGDLCGRKVVSEDGRFLGVIDDVLISGADGRIVGYALGKGHVLGRLEALVKEHPRTPSRYLRADADLRAGRELVVAPEDAIVPFDEPAEADVAETPAAPATATRSTQPTPVPQPPALQWFQTEDPRF